MQLWFDHPAARWEEGWPIGNGRLGAMVLGGVAQERLALNQDSMWYGRPIDRINPQARENLPRIRQLLLDGQIAQAELLMRAALSGTPQSERPYQPLGDLEILYRQGEDQPLDAQRRPKLTEAPRNYRRALNLTDGLVTERYETQKMAVEKEYLASYPHGVLAVRMRALRGALSLDLLLRRGRFYDRAGALDGRTIFMDGSLGQGGVSWIAAARAQADGGSCQVLGEQLLIRNARSVTLFLACETTFYEQDPQSALLGRLDEAEKAGYEAVRDAHVRDHRALFERVALRIGGESEDLPVDALFAQGREKGFSGAFAAAYFQYGRYLLIASSRPGSLPATLQGIWNEEMVPAWDSKYTININLEMNYWPAERCALPECHRPLFDHLGRMWENGRRVAWKMYGCRGFVAHHNTDIWGDCAPQDLYAPASYWVMGAAWLCTHIWTHYLYTGDLNFLREMYPILADAVLFFHDFLIDVDGTPMTCPSVSPENTYILPGGNRGCNGVGCTMDNEILRDLMEGYLKASQALGIHSEQVADTQVLLASLPPLKVGRHGQIQEWREDYDEAEPGHRHISHLYALHPSQQITPDGTPELAQAARTTLERRLQNGGGHTGWSRAWIVNFYACLGDGDLAWENLNALWSRSTFTNLMDNHPRGSGAVFQIDGNFGATSAIAEMLVQASEDRVLLLPALPQAWPEGEVRGLALPGGASVDLKWRDGALTGCTLHAAQDVRLTLCYRGARIPFALRAGESRAVAAPLQ